MIAGYDFTTYFIRHIEDAAAAQMVAEGRQLPAIGFDDAQSSRDVLATVVRTGTRVWDAYRFLNWSEPLYPQLDSVRTGVLDAYAAGLPLPGVIWLDVEEEEAGQAPVVDVRTAVHYCIDVMAAWQIGPDPAWKVRLGIYTGYWFVRKYDLLDWTEPAARGLLLWTTADDPDPDKAKLYCGWQQAEAVQFRANIASPIGTIDLDTFRDRGPAPVPPEPTPAPATLSKGLRDALDTVADAWPKERIHV